MGGWLVCWLVDWLVGPLVGLAELSICSYRSTQVHCQIYSRALPQPPPLACIRAFCFIEGKTF